MLKSGGEENYLTYISSLLVKYFFLWTYFFNKLNFQITSEIHYNCKCIQFWNSEVDTYTLHMIQLNYIWNYSFTSFHALYFAIIKKGEIVNPLWDFDDNKTLVHGFHTNQFQMRNVFQEVSAQTISKGLKINFLK